MSVLENVAVPTIERRPAAGVAAIIRERQELQVGTERLIREFHPGLSAGTVIAIVTRCRSDLVRTGVRVGLAAAVETAARGRLLAL